MTAKNLMILVTLIIALWLNSGCGGSRPTPEAKPIRIGYNAWIGYRDFYIAAEKGFFKEAGVPVELIKYDNYATFFTDLVSKKIDGCTGTTPDLVVQTAGHVAIQAVWQFDFSNGGDVLVGRKEVASPADLKGKRIGLTVGTFSHLFVEAGLNKYGLSLSDVQVVDVTEDQIEAELDKGTIDAGHTWEPYLTKALQKGHKVLFTSKDTPPGLIGDVLMIHSDVIAKRPQDVQKIVQALAKADKYWQEHQAEGNAIAAKYANVPSSDIESTLQGLKIVSLAENRLAFDPKNKDSLYENLRYVGDFFVKIKIIEKAVAPESVLNPTFINGVQ